MFCLVLGILLTALIGCASPDVTTVAGPSPTMSPGASGPRFAAGGPNAEEYGAHAGYPIKGIPRAPFFVGGFSHYDQIFEGRLIR